MRSAAGETVWFRRRRLWRSPSRKGCRGGLAMSENEIHQAVKEKYGAAAKQVAAGGTACCGGGAELSACDPISRDLYNAAEKGGLPAEAVGALLRCVRPQS